MKHILLILLAAIFILSCSEDDTSREKAEDDTESPSDTNLTPGEKFSAALLDDFLDEEDDDELADYLETTVYRMSFGYKGVSIAEISPAAWLVMFEKDSIVTNYLLQKFVDVKSNGYYFQLKETNLTIQDILNKVEQKPPAGK